MRRRLRPVFSSRLFWCALLCTFSVGCGDDGGGNGDGPTILSSSGQSTLELTAPGDPFFLGAPAYAFAFATGEVWTGIVMDVPEGDVLLIISSIFSLNASGDGGIVDLGSIELGSVAEAPETGYLGSVYFDQGEEYDWSLLVGRAFCIRTRDGAHYGKMKIVEADQSANTITFNWVYLPEGGRVFP